MSFMYEMTELSREQIFVDLDLHAQHRRAERLALGIVLQRHRAASAEGEAHRGTGDDHEVDSTTAPSPLAALASAAPRAILAWRRGAGLARIG